MPIEYELKGGLTVLIFHAALFPAAILVKSKIKQAENVQSRLEPSQESERKNHALVNDHRGTRTSTPESAHEPTRSSEKVITSLRREYRDSERHVKEYTVATSDGMTHYTGDGRRTGYTERGREGEWVHRNLLGERQGHTERSGNRVTHYNKNHERTGYTEWDEDGRRGVMYDDEHNIVGYIKERDGAMAHLDSDFNLIGSYQDEEQD